MLSNRYNLVADAQSAATALPTVVTAENNTGELPYSTTIGSGTEHVDLASGNLLINVSFVSVPGRSYDVRLRDFLRRTFLDGQRWRHVPVLGRENPQLACSIHGRLDP